MARWAGPLVVLAVAGAITARASTDEPRPVPLSVVVTDTRGQAVRNLTPADLEITEAGEKRLVASISLRGPAPRIVGLMLDEYHVDAGENTERVRAAALAFVDRHLQAGDVVYVMKPMDRQTSIAPASLDDVRRRIAEFSGRKGDFTPRSAFEAEYMSTGGSAAVRQRAQVVRSGLEALAVAMREPHEAPKALIALTEGFAPEERSRTRMMTLRTTTRAAALANLPVYVVDPSGSGSGPRTFSELWQALASQTGGMLISGESDLTAALDRIGSDLRAQYLVRFQSSGRQDGGFHGLDVKARRAGTVVRGPSGYWAPFPPVPTSRTRIDYSTLLTPHVSGLIQPWFRMSPGSDGKTRVTFMWSPRRDVRAMSVTFMALSFEGTRLHEAPVAHPQATSAVREAQTSFEVPPGPLQISMAVSNGSGRVLDTDVRYIDVPKLDAGRPVISSVEFIRPRSLPEFTALQRDANALPTEVREFLRQDRLLVRVRAFAGSHPATVRVGLLNRNGHLLLDLPSLGAIDNASQFELPFARFARGEYRLEVRATGATESITQLLMVRLIG